MASGRLWPGVTAGPRGGAPVADERNLQAG